MPRPTAKTLIVDLLSTVGRGSMPVRALIDAGTLFGLAENNIRVALARLAAAGTVDRDERGRYRLGARTHAVRKHVRSWRLLEDRVQPWSSGQWVAAYTDTRRRGHAAAARRRQQPLDLLGFRSLEAGLAIRPDNLAGGIEAVRDELFALGLGSGDRAGAAPPLVCTLGDLDANTEARARTLWDVALLREGYARSLEELETSEACLASLSTGDAMCTSFLLGGRVIRQLVLDPLLPEPIGDPAQRRALGAALHRYDERGRTCWEAFIARHGVLEPQTPLDLRVADAAHQLAQPSHATNHHTQPSHATVFVKPTLPAASGDPA